MLVCAISLLGGGCIGTDSPAAPPSSTGMPSPATTASTPPSPTTITTVTPPPTSAPLPPQPDGVPFPTEEWPRGEWPAGVDGAVIDEATDVAFGEGSGRRVRAFVVIHEGRLLYERYSPSLMDTPETLFPSFSIAKSFASALVGILVGQGRLDVSAPAAIPEWQESGDPRGAITIDDLLRMSSGLEWRQERVAGADLVRLFEVSDAALFSAKKDLVGGPGDTFNYSDGNTVLVSRIIADEVGSGDDFRRFMETELLDPIGIGDMNMRFDDVGTWQGGSVADTTALDCARLGLLFLRDGVWDEKRILPEGWVDYVRTPSEANAEYGAGWWLDLERPGVFYAIGVQGQVIGVVPEYDLVFVQLANDSMTSLELSNVLMAEFDKKS